RTVRSNDSEVGHTNLALAALFDKAHTRDAPLVAREPEANFVQKPPVDFIDDLQMPWDQYFEPRDGPFLKRFGQQRVIGVSECLLCQVPGLVPPQMSIIKQYSHQFGDCQRWMRVIKLDCCLLGQLVPVRIGTPKAADQVGERA